MCGNVGYWFSKNRTELTSKFKKPKTQFPQFGFQKPNKQNIAAPLCLLSLNLWTVNMNVCVQMQL